MGKAESLSTWHEVCLKQKTPALQKCCSPCYGGTLGSLLGMTGHQPSSAEHKLYTTHPMTFIPWDFQSWYNSCGTTVNPINKLFSMTTIRIRTISKCLLIPEAFSHSSDLLEGCFGLLLYHSYRWNQHVVLVLKLAMFLPQAVSSLAMSLA